MILTYTYGNAIPYQRRDTELVHIACCTKAVFTTCDNGCCLIVACPDHEPVMIREKWRPLRIEPEARC